MGQGTRRFKRKFKKKPQTTDAEGQNGERRAYKDIVRDSEEFVNYYKSQKILPEEEWDTFMEYLRMDLPASFRITACSSAEAQRLLEIVKSDFFAKLLSSEDGTSKPDINNLPWYPNNMGWQLELTRKDIRRSEAYFRLHNFLMSETATGNISRQETVSMIPPLLLDVRPHHKVIDLCAAPGSKTAQLIETLHGDEAIPSGFVVANDVDNSRCYMLVHQAKRLNSPCCIITNHDASNMPNFLVQNEDGTEKVLKYDRVLCDVPCTGDGTLRKNADIWAKWNVGHANNLHGVQFRILKRGLELLEVGGRLVYSTCSLNPIENEAVVLKMLHKAGDSVELINASAELNGLKCRPGMNRWNPMTKEQETALEEAAVTGDNPKNYGLEKCIRIFPQDGNTGAFFVAVLVKKSPLPWEADLPNCGSPEKSKKPQHEKRRKIRGYREDPFVFFKGDEDIWESIKSFYAIEDLDPTCLLTRCMVGKKRNIYLTAPAVKKLVDYNQDKIKFINTGVKVFARCDNKRMRCEFRLAQEGLFRIQDKIHARRVKLPEKDLITLLENHDPHNPPSLTLLTEETQELCKDIDEGSCVLDHEGTLNVSVAGWRGGKTVRAYISKPDALHYLRLFGVDTSKYDVNKFKKDEGAVAVPDDGDSKGEDQIENDSADIENGDDQTTKKPKMETISSADSQNGNSQNGDSQKPAGTDLASADS